MDLYSWPDEHHRVKAVHNVSRITSAEDVRTACIFIKGCTQKEWLMTRVSEVFCGCHLNLDDGGLIRMGSCSFCSDAFRGAEKYKDDHAIMDFKDVDAARDTFRELFQRPEADRCSRWFASEYVKEHQRANMAFFNVH